MTFQGLLDIGYELTLTLSGPKYCPDPRVTERALEAK